ncbi:MAG: serine hydrolase, partial [Gemmatimonadales bacterium]
MTSTTGPTVVKLRLGSALKIATLLLVIVATLIQPRPAFAQSEIKEWKQYADPVQAGFSVAKLNEARHYADSVRSAAVMVVYRGRVVAAWGDINRKLGLHSVRKSLVSALYGIAVAEKKIDLDATLGQLGIDEREPLTAAEKQAKVRDVISARSGVYLPAAYAGSEQGTDRPARGAYAPGAHWFYNNWDFNVAGVIYQQRTGEKLY